MENIFFFNLRADYVNDKADRIKAMYNIVWTFSVKIWIIGWVDDQIRLRQSKYPYLFSTSFFLGLLHICRIGFVSIIIDGFNHNKSKWQFSTPNSIESLQINDGIERLRSHLWWLRKLWKFDDDQFFTKVILPRSTNNETFKLCLLKIVCVFFSSEIPSKRNTTVAVAKRMVSWNWWMMYRRKWMRNVAVRKPDAIVSWE